MKEDCLAKYAMVHIIFGLELRDSTELGLILFVGTSGPLVDHIQNFHALKVHQLLIFRPPGQFSIHH